MDARASASVLLQRVFQALVKRKLPIGDTDVVTLLEMSARTDWHYDFPLSWNATAGFTERWVRAHGITPAVRDAIRAGIESLGDALVDAGDAPGCPEAPVGLWSPIGRRVDEIRAWRAWLERHEITQPFKQAHREVYLLTPAELETEFYSNRFAGHVLKQHQLAALARQRGWEYEFMGGWDSASHPTKELPDGWRVEYGIDVVEFDAPASDAGIHLYVTSDRVAFHHGDERATRALVEVPRHVFSEAMRDVDLFVGVATRRSSPRSGSASCGIS